MKVVIQRVLNASVTTEGQKVAVILNGLLILLGIVEDDNNEDINWLTKKIVNLRVFADDDGVMNKSLIDCNGDCIVVSQFTLHASTKKGNRPSYIKAAKPDVAIPLYKSFVKQLEVELINDGPVTIIIDSKNKE